MQVVFESAFLRDVKRVRDKNIRRKVQEVIDQVKTAVDLQEIPHISKLRGHQTYYRVRSGDYRVGLEVVDDKVIFVRFLHRKDIYRYFP